MLKVGVTECSWSDHNAIYILAPQRTFNNIFVNVVLWGLGHTNMQFVMGDVCRSRNVSLSEHRIIYNGVESVSGPFMSEAGMS